MAVDLPAIRQRIVVDDSALGGLSRRFGKVGGMLGKAVAGGAALAAGGVAAFAAAGAKAAVDVDRGIREVVTLFGVTGDEAEAMSAKLTSGVADLSNEVGIAQDVITGGLYQAISAGIPEDNVFEFMEVAAEASVAGVTDIETAVDGLTTTINAFGLEADDAGDVADSMFAAVQGGKTTFEELSSSLFQVAPAAAAAGVGFDEVNAAIATLTAGGTPTAVATTRIRAAIDELNKPTAQAAKAFEDIAGKSFREFIAAGGDLQGALAILQDEAGKTGAQVGDYFGSVEAAGAATTLAATGAEKFTEELDRQAGRAGAAGDAFDVMAESTARQLETLKVTITNVAIELGQAILPAINKVASFLAERIPPAIDTVRNAFSGLVALFGRGDFTKELGDAFNIQEDSPIVGALFRVREAVIAVVGWFREHREAIGRVVAAVGPAVAIVAGLAGSFKILSGAMRLAVAATPLGVILALAAGLVYAWQNSERFREVVTAAFEKVSAVVGPILESVMGWIGGLAGMFDQAREGLSGGGLFDGLAGMAGTVAEIFGQVVEVIGGVVDFTVMLWQRWGERIVGFVVSGLARLAQVVQGALDVIKGIFDVIIGVFTGDWARAWEGLSGVVSGAWNVIQGLIAGALNVVLTALSLGLDALKGIWSAAWGALSGLASSAWDAFTDWLGRAVASVVDAVVRFGRDVKDRFRRAWEDVKTTTVRLVDGVVDYVKKMPERFLRGLARLGGMLRDTAAAAWRMFSDATTRAVDAVVRYVTEFPGRLLRGLRNIGELLFDTGRDLIQGLLDGIKAMAGRIADTVLGPIQDGIASVKSWLGIGSPSRLMRQIGVDTGEGFALGLDDRARDVAAMAGRLGAAVVDPLTDAAGRVAGALDNVRPPDAFARTMIGDLVRGASAEVPALVRFFGVDLPALIHDALSGALADVAGSVGEAFTAKLTAAMQRVNGALSILTTGDATFRNLSQLGVHEDDPLVAELLAAGGWRRGAPGTGMVRAAAADTAEITRILRDLAPDPEAAARQTATLERLVARLDEQPARGPLEVNVYNPVRETAEASLNRQMRKLAHLGAI